MKREQILQKQEAVKATYPRNQVVLSTNRDNPNFNVDITTKRWAPPKDEKHGTG